MSEYIVEAVKGELSLRVLGAPYGVDRQGQEFHTNTDFGDLPIVPAIYWHGWGQDDGERIGWAHKAERDSQGQWYRVVLDATKATARKVYDAAVKGMARASSDAIGHLVRPKGILGKAGRVDRWVIGALSLMDEATYQSAVNPRAIALPALKALYEELIEEDVEAEELDEGIEEGIEEELLELEEALKAKGDAGGFASVKQRKWYFAAKDDKKSKSGSLSKESQASVDNLKEAKNRYDNAKQELADREAALERFKKEKEGDKKEDPVLSKESQASIDKLRRAKASLDKAKQALADKEAKLAKFRESNSNNKDDKGYAGFKNHEKVTGKTRSDLIKVKAEAKREYIALKKEYHALEDKKGFSTDRQIDVIAKRQRELNQQMNKAMGRLKDASAELKWGRPKGATKAEEAIDESGDAVKAGATFSKRNRERILAIKQQLDELFSEFPEEPSDIPLQQAAISGQTFESMPVKADAPARTAQEVIKNMDEKNRQAEGEVKPDAVKAEAVDIETLIASAADAAAAKAIESLPKTDEKQPETPAAKAYSQDEVLAMVQKAADKAAAKATDEAVKAAQRLHFPVVVKKEEDYADPLPVLWAVKAAYQTGGNIVFNFKTNRQGLEYDGSGDAVKAFKAMATTNGSAIGEHFIPRVQTDLVINALYQSVVTRSLPSVNVYPMPGLICDAPTIAAFSANWSAENATATSAGDAATGRKTLVAKNLTSLATVSNQLLADSSPAIEKYIREGVASAMGEKHDSGALYGSGSGNEPLGITGTAGVTSTAVGSDDFYTAVLKAVSRMAANKLPVSPRNIAVIARPEVIVKALTTRVGTNGDFISAASFNTGSTFAGAALQDRVSARLGYQVFSTTVIPASTTPTSSILVLYCPDFVIGDRQEMEIAASNVAGNAFANNQTLIRAIMRVDFLLMRAASLEIVTGVAH